MKSFSRRRLLAAIAAAGGASRLAPFLPRSLYGAEVAPKRILVVFSPMGYLENTFWPQGSGSSFTLGETQTALNPFKSKLLYPDGLHLYGGGGGLSDDNEHGGGGNCVFTGSSKKMFANGPSIDQHVAEFLYKQAQTPFKSLSVGWNSSDGDPHGSVFYSKAQTPIIPQWKPNAVWQRLFSNFTPPVPSGGGGSTDPDPAAVTLREQQQSVLDFIKRDLNKIRGAAGKADQIKIDDHMDGISTLERRLKGITGGSGMGAPAGTVGSGCVKPPEAEDKLELTETNVRNGIHSQMDLIVSAFACDLTRSASLQLGICDGYVDAMADLGQHDCAHAVGEMKASPKSLADHQKWDRWYADRWAYLLGRLDAIQEGNGTLLDNTLIIFGSDTTTNTSGEYVGPHQHARFPLWMAGGGNFAFKTGQVLKLPSPPLSVSPQDNKDLAKRWVVHQRLLTSVCQAFGMPDQKFGDIDPGSGPLPQLQRA